VASLSILKSTEFAIQLEGMAKRRPSGIRLAGFHHDYAQSVVGRADRW
jgi:HD superfamily phosphohydrolase YqeK